MRNYTFAVLVDGENASSKDFAAVLREVEKQGDVALKRVYADWTQPSQSSWKEVLHETGARPFHQFNYGKDAADHALIMDAIELTLNTPRLDAVCIVSSDGGFHTLAQRIREKGLYVMGIGRRNTPERMRRACHQFVYTDLLDANVVEQERTEERDLESLLIEAFEAAQNEQDAVYLGALGSQLRKLDPAFDPRTYAFRTLKELVKANSAIFQVVSETKDEFYIELTPAAALKPAEEVMNGIVSRWIKHYGFIESDGDSYYFAKINLVPEQRELRLKKGDRVRFVVAKAPEGDSEHSADRNGKAKQVELIEL